MKNNWNRSWFVLSMILLFILAPLTFDLNSGDISVSAVFAKSDNGGGNGNGNGNGGGHGGSDSAGHGHSAEAKGEAAHGQAHNAGLGHQKQGYAEDMSSAKSKSKGVSASQLGRLNAAHASPNAREHAAPNSAVGRIATYEAAVYERQDAQLQLEALLEDETVTRQQIEEAQLAVEEAAQLEVETLSAAANKAVNEDVAQAVNELLGIEPLDSELDAVSAEATTPELI